MPDKPLLHTAVPPVGPPREAPPARRACLFVLDAQPFAVDVCDAREVVVIESCTPVPGAPPPLVGVTNLRGTILPVVEIRPLLGLAARPVTPGTRALVLADDERVAAVVIDRLLGLDWYDARRLLPRTAGGRGAAYTAGLLARDGEHVTLLDGQRILASLRALWVREDR